MTEEIKDKEVVEEKEQIEEIDAKGRAINSRWELRTIYRIFSGLSGLKDQRGQTISEKKLVGQPSYASGRNKDKIRPIIEKLEEEMTFPPDSQASKKGQKRTELISQYGTSDERGNIIFSSALDREERDEFRESLRKLDDKYPNAEKEVDDQNKRLKKLGDGKIRWEPFLIDIESQLGKLTADDWEILGRRDNDGKFLFLRGSEEKLDEALRDYKEEIRKEKKKGKED